MHENKVAQKYKVTLIVWAQIFAVQFLSLAFITYNVPALILGMLNGVVLFKAMEF